MASKGTGGLVGQTTSVQTKRKIKNEDDEHVTKGKVACDHPFTIPGEYKDEISMEFSDNKQLYVSKMLLCHISPVFAKMFEKDAGYVENKEKKIKMEGKSYDDVLELLLHVHPRIQKEVNRNNVYKIIPLVEEYMIDGSKKKCRLCLLTILKESDGKRTIGLRDIIDVLVTASHYRYDVLRQYAREILTTWEDFPYHDSDWLELYSKIPHDDKFKILQRRLKHKRDAFVPLGLHPDTC